MLSAARFAVSLKNHRNMQTMYIVCVYNRVPWMYPSVFLVKFIDQKSGFLCIGILRIYAAEEGHQVHDVLMDTMYNTHLYITSYNGNTTNCHRKGCCFLWLIKHLRDYVH